MDEPNYRRIAADIGPRRSLGQNFLISKDIAIFEAQYAKGMNALELGPGLGILTRELCKTAKRVVAIEKDRRFISILKEGIDSKRLKLVEGDFFSTSMEKLKPIDIMISNIPYNLSSKTIYWLSQSAMPALLCIQKEFAEHMLASPGSKNYSKLSVVSALEFKVHHVKDISARNFYPVPKVDSQIIYLAPRGSQISNEILSLITLIMNHKKKRLKNAVFDCAKELGMGKEKAKKLSENFADSGLRPLHLPPERILEMATKLRSQLKDIQKE